MIESAFEEKLEGKISADLRDFSVTRELCLELIDKIIIGAPNENGKPQNIEIYYKIDLNAA